MPKGAKQRWNMVVREELAREPIHVQYFEYADAYLDSARRLCSILARSTRRANFQRGAVVLYLVQDALELFYKAAILRVAPKERLSHGIDRLRARYLALYPGKDYSVRPLFVPSYAGLTKAQAAEAKRTLAPADQIFRYPDDRDGVLWEGLYGFEASSCLRDIDGLIQYFKRVRTKLTTRTQPQSPPTPPHSTPPLSPH